MATAELTAEQRQLVDQAGDRPVRIEDPETHQAYVLVRADLYERVRDVLEPTPVLDLAVPELVRRSQEAFHRDLPALLQDARQLGRWVAYHGDERVAIGCSEVDVVRECLRRDLRPNQYDVFVIRPQSMEPEEIDYPTAWSDA